MNRTSRSRPSFDASILNFLVRKRFCTRFSCIIVSPKGNQPHSLAAFKKRYRERTMSDDAENEELLSLERARADIEIIQSCYPDEISSCSSCDDSSTFPFQFTLALSADSDANNLTIRLEPGYPFNSGVQIANYRTDSVQYKARLEAVVRAVRKVSSECQEQ